MGSNRNDVAYVAMAKALKAKTRREGLPCWLCHHTIDTSLDYRHPMSFTADHVKPVALGGAMTGDLRPAHRSCNSRRGVGRVPVRVGSVVPSVEY